ncbi:MAG: beta-propeller fold lactonase family protein, partial [Gemmatimonadales bacterium]
RLDTWDNIISGSRYGEALIPFDKANSLMLEMAIRLVGGPHPTEHGEAGLTGNELEIISHWIQEGAPSSTGETPFSGDREFVYVTNQSAALVSVIDVATNQVVRTVDLVGLGFTPNAKPHDVAVEPDGAAWYVSLITDNVVLKFDRNNNFLGRVEFERPGLLALSHANNTLYVGRSMAAVNPPQRIGVIDGASLELEEVDVFFPRPHALAVAPDGANVYTASLALNQIATADIADIAEEDLALTNIAGDNPHVFVEFAISPDGNTMVAATEMTSQFMIFDISDPPNVVLQESIDINAAPWHPIYSRDGRYVYVGNKNANTVTVVDMQSRAVVDVIEGNGLAEPHGSALSADGRYVYISNRNLAGAYTPRYDLGDNANAGTVVVIDTESREIIKVIEVDEYAAGMGGR